MLIRLAEPSEHRGIVKAAITGVQNHERAVVGDPVQPTEDAIESYLQYLMHRVVTKDGLILVAEIDGRIVGTLIGYTDEDDDYLVQAEFNRFAFISDLYVIPEMRRRGIAKKLITRFNELMRERGFPWVRIFVKSKNRGALESYLKYGFEEYETVLAVRL